MSGVKEFHDIAHFLAHLAHVEVAVKVTEHHALEHACRIIEKDAKGQFGRYQGDVPPFGAWPPLAETTLKQHNDLGVGDTPLLVSGYLRESISHEVEGKNAVVGSDDDVMVYQELGTDKIPPRPVLGPAGIKSGPAVAKLLGEAVVEAMEYGAVADWVKLK
jgi:phage gpG-like protein